MFKFLKRNNKPQTPETAGSGTASPSTEHDASPSPAEILPEPTLASPSGVEPPAAAAEPGHAEPKEVTSAAPAVAEIEQSASKPGLFSRIRSGLTRTRTSLAEGLSNLILGRKEIDAELLEALEEQLLLADVGMAATRQIIDQLSDRVARKQLADVDALHAALRAALAEILKPVSLPLRIDDSKRPYVLLVIGVNGVGKTTTIGKLAKRYGQQGKKVMLAAGDTFRAAAVEQLKVWGERNQVPVVAQQSGADSASVLFDALSAAKARGIDLLIADTAGRLHNKAHLLEELKKVVRVLKKIDPEAPHEVLLVLDASTGQNALNQAQQFRDAVDVSGIALTKLDGTAKGGVIFAIAQQLGLPIRFIGVGEAIDDLRPFDADEFIRALFERDPV